MPADSNQPPAYDALQTASEADGSQNDVTTEHLADTAKNDDASVGEPLAEEPTGAEATTNEPSDGPETSRIEWDRVEVGEAVGGELEEGDFDENEPDLIVLEADVPKDDASDSGILEIGAFLDDEFEAAAAKAIDFASGAPTEPSEPEAEAGVGADTEPDTPTTPAPTDTDNTEHAKDSSFSPEKSTGSPAKTTGLGSHARIAESDSETDFDPEQVARSRRSRRTYLGLIVALVAVAGLLIWYGYSALVPIISGKPSVPSGVSTDLPTSEITPIAAPLTITYEKIALPRLTGFFGLTTEQVLASLGNGWQISKVSEAGPAAEGQPAPAVRSVVTITFKPQVTSINGGSGSEDEIARAVEDLLPVANVYLSLDAEMKVIEISMVTDLDLLEYPQSDFSNLLADDRIITNVLATTGIDARDFYFQSPDYDSTITYDNPYLETRKIIRQSVIYSGRTNNEGLPVAWTITVTYDFIPPVASALEIGRAHRVLHISLS